MKYVARCFPSNNIDYAPNLAVVTVTPELLEHVYTLQKVAHDNNLKQVQVSAGLSNGVQNPMNRAGTNLLIRHCTLQHILSTSHV